MFAFILTPVLMITVTTSHPLDDREPMCSKFDYDEKLLEKMVRMEVKMETLLQEDKAREQKMMSLAEGLSERIGNVESNTIEFQRGVNQTMVEFDDKFKEELAKLTALSDKIILRTVAFNVRLSSTKTIGKGDKFIYNTEITNLGEGYDKLTGIFTAPYTGLYSFSAHVCTNGHNAAHYAIHHESNTIAHSVHHDKAGVCSSVSTVVMVNKDEILWVQCEHSMCVLYTNDHRWNTFTGYLSK